MWVKAHIANQYIQKIIVDKACLSDLNNEKFNGYHMDMTILSNCINNIDYNKS